MYRYGQDCPIAKALEVVGDRWTLLIVRDLLTGTTQFNELERGLPGISRALLAERLGILERSAVDSERSRSIYRLSRAGTELQAVLDALLLWGAAWAFETPTPEELNPLCDGRMVIDAAPMLAQAFPRWFLGRLAAPAMRASGHP